MSLFKNRVLRATLWSFLQRAGSLIIGFVANIVLARLLEPEDFGCIALILVFVGFADILIDSGLSSALIQKKDINERDISTVFSVNLVISIILFVVIIILASSIGRFVGQPNLAIYLRVESIAVLIRAFYCIQAALLSKNLQFKDLAKFNILASFFSASIAIVLAALGCGVWSLVAKNMVLQLSLCILYRHASRTSYRIGFFRENFFSLFRFGWFVALTTFLDTLYSNLTAFLIGKRYSVKDLGYYNQAKSLEQIPVYSLSMVITQVLFPFMSKMQDDGDRVLNNTRRVIIVTTFFAFPLMVYLIFFAKPVIVLLYSSKWTASAVYFQILCFGGIVNSLIHVCRNVLKSIGETKVLFYTQMIITSLAIVGVVFFLRFDIKILVAWVAVCSYINWLTTSYITGRRIGYGLLVQLKDIALNILFALIAGVVSFYGMKQVISSDIFLALFGAVVYMVCYLILHYLLNTKSIQMVLSLIK